MVTKEEFITRVKNAHPGIFNLENVEFKGISKYATLYCKKHGKITKKARCFVNGTGCAKCAKIARTQKKIALLDLFTKAGLTQDLIKD